MLTYHIWSIWVKPMGKVPGSPSDLNTGNGTEGAMVCTKLGSLLRPLFYFLCSNLKTNPVHFSPLIVIHLVYVRIFEDEIDDSEEKAVGG